MLFWNVLLGSKGFTNHKKNFHGRNGNRSLPILDEIGINFFKLFVLKWPSVTFPIDGVLVNKLSDQSKAINDAVSDFYLRDLTK